MNPIQTAPRNIDAYLMAFTPEVRRLLQKIRSTIHKAAPKAQEAISYKIPAFKLNGRDLIYFAAYKKHVAVYPVPAGDAEFKKTIEKYRAGKGTLRFPLDEPISYSLISKVVKFRMKENAVKANADARGQ
jgi:uncharacterized protein YdhG (YjbR/CyaY superfamily)